MVSSELYEGSIDEAVTINNPLTEDFVHMRRTLVPSLLKVVQENKNHESINLFEIANVYHKKPKDLPDQILKVALITKKPKNSFFAMKGIIEQLLTDIGITDITWKERIGGGNGASIFLGKNYLGDIEILDRETINAELDFLLLLKQATIKKIYKPLSKYPPSIEDLALIAPEHVKTGEIIDLIKKQSTLISEVTLFDKYQETRTFHVIYQSYEKNLTSEEVGEIRKKVLKVLREKLDARLKE
jgi:phenylalanyl-tRNA synthetase beta chain